MDFLEIITGLYLNGEMNIQPPETEEYDRDGFYEDMVKPVFSKSFDDGISAEDKFIRMSKAALGEGFKDGFLTAVDIMFSLLQRTGGKV